MTQIPKYIQDKPQNVQSKWTTIYNSGNTASEGIAMANYWLLNQVTTVPKANFMTLKFEADNTNGFIKCSEAGEEFIDFILTDNKVNSKGQKFTKEVIMKLIDQINSGDVLIGDIDHLEYDKILSGAYSRDKTVQLLKSKPGIAKTLKAIYEDGNLWVRAVVDKRYASMIKNKAKGVSLEGLFETTETGEVIDGILTGFTFAVENQPVNARARLA